LLKKHGFIVLATFIVGAPTETLNEAYETLRFIQNAPFDDIELCQLTPFPGTPLYPLYNGQNDWSQFNVLNQKPLLYTKLTQQELRQIWLDFHKIQRAKRRRYLLKRGIQNPWKLYSFIHKRMWRRG
jgi:radical SAM superfamily enzyme YgiQ (UPF0313 family)